MLFSPVWVLQLLIIFTSSTERRKMYKKMYTATQLAGLLQHQSAFIKKCNTENCVMYFILKTYKIRMTNSINWSWFILLVCCHHLFSCEQPACDNTLNGWDKIVFKFDYTLCTWSAKVVLAFPLWAPVLAGFMLPP